MLPEVTPRTTPALSPAADPVGGSLQFVAEWRCVPHSDVPMPGAYGHIETGFCGLGESSFGPRRRWEPRLRRGYVIWPYDDFLPILPLDGDRPVGNLETAVIDREIT